MSSSVLQRSPEQVTSRRPRRPQEPYGAIVDQGLAAIAKGVAHDLNNLLNIISGHLSAAVTQGMTSLEMEQHLHEALLASRRAQLLNQQALRAARGLPTKREPTDVAAIIRETARIIQGNAGTRMHLHISQNLSWAEVDAVKIGQVVQNLIMNGIQAMHGAGDLTITARNVQLPQASGRLQPGDYLEISVCDSGGGIAPENLPHIFREYFTTKRDGNGIGLSACRRIVEEHHGDIRVSSRFNFGTEFVFYILAEERRNEAFTHAPKSSPPNGEGTILVVDDEPAVRRLCSLLLKRHGYKVHEASSGAEALHVYQELGTVDVVLMDLTLGGKMDGERTLGEILRLDPDARVIASSGALLEENRRSYLAAGFVDILPKPYEANDLASAVQRVLREQNKTQTEFTLQ